ncbi:hypothetical protein A3844_06540 [Paenibacillus helianthi]|uniref:DUF3153 domain-containing protein n=1 Tax=Paenibacillus helianthi TaxID=1349432 RepID=A0ABX3EUP7_9BACL|nr:hypothetical protein [Paenibacillus helianthi]OKP89629.1 hypothetical protein A3844_06540 [Paenibacillus helianthi]
MKWRTLSILGLVLLMLVLVTGCANGTAHVTVKKDGGMDIAFNLKLDSRAESLAGGTIEDLLRSRLQAAGIELHKTKVGKSTEYQFLKSYASIQDVKLNAGNLDIVDTQVDTENKWLYTRYDVVAQPKLNAYSDKILDTLGTLSVPKSLVRLFMQSQELAFKLTLPYNLYGPNNADEQDGNTLTWHITMADSVPMRLVVYVPDIRNIAIAGGVVILLLALAVTLFIRKRKSLKPKGFEK